jgi:hypothetical protein
MHIASFYARPRATGLDNADEDDETLLSLIGNRHESVVPKAFFSVIVWR